MHDFNIQKLQVPSETDIIHVDNCDKDGTIVAKRLASITNRVASTRALRISVDRQHDNSIASDSFDALSHLYGLSPGNGLLNPDTLVLSSVHRTGLYIAEVLHAKLLPLQVISFANELDNLLESNGSGIIGSDYDFNGFWIWNKPLDVGQLSESYLKEIARANKLVIVRSSDSGKDCPILGHFGRFYINSTVNLLSAPRRSRLENIALDTENSYEFIRQWEWGLPDQTIHMLKDHWNHLGKNHEDFTVIEGDTKTLYNLIPSLWAKYLNNNKIAPAGITLNSYWTAHPYFERSAGLIPFHFYCFNQHRDFIDQWLAENMDKFIETSKVFAFSNETDAEDVVNWLADHNVDQKSYYSKGCDCKDAICVDIFGQKIEKPYVMISKIISQSPYYNIKFLPLTVDDLNCVVETLG